MRFFRIQVVGCAAGAILASGCHLLPYLPNQVQDLGPRYHPSNVYRQADVLPPQIRRVAVLPIAAPNVSTYTQAGLESLSPLLYPELDKCKRFEVISVAPEQLRQWTGKISWKTEELLPPDFFARLKDATGCDAVLFTELTRYSPYQPLAVGWRFSLVAVPPAELAPGQSMRNQIIWSADEVMDAGDLAVANAARDYYQQHLRNEEPAGDATTILNSPARFGQYTMAALFETIPGRFAPCQKGAKVTYNNRR